MAPRGLPYGLAVCGLLGVLWWCGAFWPPAQLELQAHSPSHHAATPLRPPGLAMHPVTARVVLAAPRRPPPSALLAAPAPPAARDHRPPPPGGGPAALRATVAALALLGGAAAAWLRSGPGAGRRRGRGEAEPCWGYGGVGGGLHAPRRLVAMAAVGGAQGASEAKALYEKVAGVRTPVRGYFLANKDSVWVQYSQLDFFSSGPDGRLPRRRSFVVQGDNSPQELPTDVLFTVPETNGDRTAVFKAPAAQAKDAPTGGWVEIWNAGGLERCYSLGSDSGPALADAWFGGADWSPDGTRLVFTAEPQPPGRAHWGQAKDGDPLDPTGLSLKFRQRQDWGELYTAKVCAPKVYTLDLLDGMVRSLVAVDDPTLSCGQPLWASDTEVVFVAWTQAERLGVVYCHQRAFALFAVAVPAAEGGSPAPPPRRLTTDPLDFSVRSPRLSPDRQSIVFLAREPVGPHFTAARLRALDLATQTVRTVVDVVADPLDGAFPGLYASALPRRCWIGPTTLAATTTWGLDEALVVIDVATGAVARRRSPHHPALHSAAVLDADALTGRCLVSVSSPTTPPGVFVVAPDGEWWAVAAPCPRSAAAQATACAVSVERIVLPTDDGVGAAHFDSLVLWPPAVPPSGPPPPLVLFAHGGPHSSIPTTWAVGPLMLALAGYAVVLPNYRGSTGYGEQALNSLPGRIGDQAEGRVDAQRLAVVGGSHGGFLACHLTSQPALAHRFRAAATRNPVTNLPLLLGTSDIEDWVVFEAGLGTEAERLTCCGGVGLSALADGLSADDWRALAKKSPSSNVTHVRAATLLLLGLSDRRVPPSQGQFWARALRGHGAAPVLCYEYADNAHALAEPFADGDGWVNTVAWLRQHV